MVNRGVGIRLIEEASVWQILLYRSFGLTALLYIVIRWRTGKDPFVLVRRAGIAGGDCRAVTGLCLYRCDLLHADGRPWQMPCCFSPFHRFWPPCWGGFFLRERVRIGTWVAVVVAIAGVSVMFADKSGAVSVPGSLAAFASALGFACFTVALRSGKSVEMMPSVFLSGVFAIFIMGGMCLP